MTSGMEFRRSPPDHHSELSQATQAAAAAAALGHNHPLGVLSNLTALNMNMPGLSGLASGLAASGLHHGADVLEKLKMQVRDMKVGALMSEQMAADFAASLHASSPFGAAALAASQAGVGNGLAMFGVGREMDGGGRGAGPAGSLGVSGGAPGGTSAATTTGSGRESRDTTGSQNGTGNSNNSGSGSSNNFSFTLPNAPISKDGNPGSNSSTSSETSNSSQQNNGWSFEEQFKQVRQLYEINDDPKRKEFLDDLFLFMQKRGTPINRLPIMAKSVLDLYELYNLVIARGGLVDVINKKLWQEIIKGLHLPSSITSAAFTLRTQYMKYLYPYECEKKNLSTPAELQAAIDGNRREGRRSSYGQFDSPSVQRSPIPQGMSQIPPMSLVSHVNQQQQQQHHHHHHRLLPPVGQIPNILPAEFEQRMLDYIKLFQPKEMTRAQSPDGNKLSALNALEISRVALWNMYNPSPNSPPNSLNTSPENNMQSALDLSESPDHAMPSIKRERTEHPVDFSADPRDFSAGHPPPAKRSHQQQQQHQQQQPQHHHHHHHHSHSRSLTPLKLNSSSHDEDELRSVTGTPINLRENGTTTTTSSLHHHEDADEDEDEEEEEDEEPTEEDILRASLVASQHHPLALSLADHHLQQQHQQQQRERERVQQHVAAQAAAVQQHLQQQQQHLASLDLSVLDRERVRCGSADGSTGNKLKRHQLHDDEQSQQEQEQEQQHQHQQQQQHQGHHHNHNHHQRQHQQQQQSSRASRAHLGRGKHAENGDRLSLTPDSDFHHSTKHASSGGNVGTGGRALNADPFSSPMGITGMQFKLISRGDASKGDQKLVVTMEFNGVQYEGVLFANPLPLSTNTVSAPTSTPPSSSVSATSASPIGSLVSPVKTVATISPLEERTDDRAAATAAAASSSLTSNGPTAAAPAIDPALTTNGGGASNLDASHPTIGSATTASCSQPQQVESGGPTVPTAGISSPLVS
ncbi:protein dead ringer-like isoform X2 [Anopheles albimanus]|nr:protein dead ringer-like isoform X2 [Anopheles albimanus]